MNKQSIHIFGFGGCDLRGVCQRLCFIVIGEIFAALTLGGSVLVPSIGVRRLYKDLVLLSWGGCPGRPFHLFPLPF